MNQQSLDTSLLHDSYDGDDVENLFYDFLNFFTFVKCFMLIYLPHMKITYLPVAIHKKPLRNY